MDLQLAGKRALVTGASRGIGRAIAERLAAEGCNLYLTARAPAPLQAVREDLRASSKVEIEVHACDLMKSGLLTTHPVESVEQALTVIGWYRLRWHIEQLFRTLKRQGLRIEQSVVEDGEALEKLVVIALIVATITNSGLMAFTRALGSVSPDKGVRVLGVNPGPTLTERLELLMKKKSADRTGDAGRWQELVAPLPFGRAATPGEVADLVVYAASPRASYVSGTVLTVDGGVSARGRLF